MSSVSAGVGSSHVCTGPLSRAAGRRRGPACTKSRNRPRWWEEAIGGSGAVDRAPCRRPLDTLEGRAEYLVPRSLEPSGEAGSVVITRSGQPLLPAAFWCRVRLVVDVKQPSEQYGANRYGDLAKRPILLAVGTRILY
jgi:hypothetical protein